MLKIFAASCSLRAVGLVLAYYLNDM